MPIADHTAVSMLLLVEMFTAFKLPQYLYLIVESLTNLTNDLFSIADLFSICSIELHV